MDIGAKILFPVAESETLSVQTGFWMSFSKNQMTVCFRKLSSGVPQGYVLSH